jgi:valyl-tRNA synthetase
MGQAAVLATADALVRSARDHGSAVEWRLALMVGDTAGQREVERELARQGLDRATLGRAGFVERSHEFANDARDQAGALLDELGVEVDLDPLDSQELARAARTAFVRFYEEGRLRRAEEVLATCPRCGSCVDLSVADRAVNEVSRLRLSLPLTEQSAATVEVGIVAPELLPGAVALVVPHDHFAIGDKVEVPVASRYVPVLAGEVAEPELLIPAHDARSWDLARALGLGPAPVLDPEGVVRASGPLEGLSRFAAREAATRLLEAEGLLQASEPAEEVTWCCPACGTPLVPRLGRYWFLAIADLEVAAADALREGVVIFHPPGAREELIAGAGDSGPWCLSNQVWTGLPVPVSTCLDCGRSSVAVELDASCPTCMGTLVAEGEVLDARFVAGLWPLAVAGWPGRRDDGPDEPLTVMVAAAGDISPWVRPVAALGCALAGAVPFDHLVVLPPESGSADDADDVAASVERDGRTATRMRLRARVDPMLTPLLASIVAGSE